MEQLLRSRKILPGGRAKEPLSPEYCPPSHTLQQSVSFPLSSQMILVAIFAETGFFDYCAVKVSLKWLLGCAKLFFSVIYLVNEITASSIF